MTECVDVGAGLHVYTAVLYKMQGLMNMHSVQRNATLSAFTQQLSHVAKVLLLFPGSYLAIRVLLHSANSGLGYDQLVLCCRRGGGGG